VTGQRSNQLNYDPAIGVIGLAETLVTTGDLQLNRFASVVRFKKGSCTGRKRL
jgi:hypothetical protein